MSEPTKYERATALLMELYEWSLDACHQGSGAPFGSPQWHCYISTWEEADELLPRVLAFLQDVGIAAAGAVSDSGEPT